MINIIINEKNPTLLNVTYVRPTKKNGGKEYFEVIYKSEDGTVKKIDDAPNASIYIVKPEYRTYDYNKPEERIEKMDKVIVKISGIKREIAKQSGEWGKRIFQRAYSENDYKYLNQLYKWKYCYTCDFQPEYYYMKDWYDRYELKNVTLTKAFLDIETDLMDYRLDMDNIPNTAYSPVNVVTIILDETNETYTFVLRPYEPPRMGKSEEEYKIRYQKYEKQKHDHEYLFSHLDEFINRCHKEFDSVYGYSDYHIREYEREIDLINDVFSLINTRKPNFCESWNMRFDIQYLYYRILALHYNPADIMCHRDFEDKRCSFKVDRSTYRLEKQYDYFYCSSYTQYICQMRNYASIRKSQHKLRSVSLNAIADRELKDKKVEYPEETNMTEFPYKDWILFILYNIKDVKLQGGIEKKVKDTMTYYMRSHANMTPYNKIYKETHLLRNVREMYFEKQGWAQGNNLNIIDTDEDELARQFYGTDDEDSETIVQSKASYKGAINADPIWNDYVGVYILDSRTNNVFNNTMDYDMGAFYPSIKIASNMDPITLDYKASFINDEFISGECTNRSLNTQYYERDKYNNLRELDITGEAVNTYVSGNILTFGYNYLNLPSITSMYKEVQRRLNA